MTAAPTESFTVVWSDDRLTDTFTGDWTECVRWLLDTAEEDSTPLTEADIVYAYTRRRPINGDGWVAELTRDP